MQTKSWDTLSISKKGRVPLSSRPAQDIVGPKATTLSEAYFNILNINKRFI